MQPIDEADAFIKHSFFKVLTVMRYSDCHESLQKLSPHGGDEDWIALVPPSDTVFPFWIGRGYEEPEPIELPSGWKVYIGAH